MKKVLIIANLFHASPRIPGIAKYLNDFGWDPTILTVSIKEYPRHSLGFPAGFKEKVRIIEVPCHRDILWFWRKLFKVISFKTNESILNQVKEKIGLTSRETFIDSIFKFYMTLFAYPDGEKGWKKPALKTARDLLEKEKFDALISSSSPVTSHIIATKLKEKYNIPWLADFRDLWTQNHNYPYPDWRKAFEKRLEERIISSADALVSVSWPLVEELKAFHKKEITCMIANGFDPEKVNNPPVSLTEKFTITYTGQIYGEKKQDPMFFLIALRDLISDGIIDPNDVEVRFYGPKKNWLEDKIKKYGLSDIVRQYGLISREACLIKQRESQLLLFLKWQEEKGVYTGKIFEYLAARRPILLAARGKRDDVVEKLLFEARTGFWENDNHSIKDLIRESYLEYKEKGEVSYRGDLSKVNKYNHRKMAESFTAILNKIK